MTTNKVGMDPLTHCRVYASFEADFESLIREADINGEDLSLCLLDIDHFLKINEEFGHDAGDEVLRKVAAHIKSIDDGKNYIYRYSGDEFAVLMPGVEKEQALLVMEKLRAAFPHGIAVNAEEPQIVAHATISIGVAAYRDDGANVVELVRKADGAMFRAKMTGRNKVCLAREEKMVTKTSHYTVEQLKRLTALSQKENTGEAVLLREALDDLLKKYDE